MTLVISIMELCSFKVSQVIKQHRKTVQDLQCIVLLLPGKEVLSQILHWQESADPRQIGIMISEAEMLLMSKKPCQNRRGGNTAILKTCDVSPHGGYGVIIVVTNDGNSSQCLLRVYYVERLAIVSVHHCTGSGQCHMVNTINDSISHKCY